MTPGQVPDLTVTGTENENAEVVFINQTGAEPTWVKAPLNSQDLPWLCLASTSSLTGALGIAPRRLL